MGTTLEEKRGETMVHMGVGNMKIDVHLIDPFLGIVSYLIGSKEIG